MIILIPRLMNLLKVHKHPPCATSAENPKRCSFLRVLKHRSHKRTLEALLGFSENPGDASSTVTVKFLSNGKLPREWCIIYLDDA